MAPTAAPGGRAMSTVTPIGARHRALLYSGREEYVALVCAFVREGLAAGEETMVAAPGERLDWIRAELGPDAARVRMEPGDCFFGRPGPRIAGLQRMLVARERAGAPPLRLVAEPPLERLRPGAQRALLRWEAAVNVILAPYAASLLCPYDAVRHPPELLREVRCTHPELVGGAWGGASADYREPEEYLQRRPPRAPFPLGAAHALRRPADLAGARTLVRGRARAAGLSSAHTDDLVTAVSEIATNAIEHGRAPRALVVAAADGVLACRVRDSGPGLASPLTGYAVPAGCAASGRGLWLAHQLVDVVDVASGPEGTEVTLEVTLEGELAPSSSS